MTTIAAKCTVCQAVSKFSAETRGTVVKCQTCLKPMRVRSNARAVAGGKAAVTPPIGTSAVVDSPVAASGDDQATRPVNAPTPKSRPPVQPTRTTARGQTPYEPELAESAHPEAAPVLAGAATAEPEPSVALESDGPLKRRPTRKPGQPTPSTEKSVPRKVVLRPRRRQHTGTEYTKPGRLQDVLTLIQFLALDPSTSSSEDGPLHRELEHPTSMKKDERWSDLALEHPEFFRVTESDKGTRTVRFTCRWLSQVGKRQDPFPVDAVQRFLEMAIGIHEQQVNNARLENDREKLKLLYWTSVISGLVAVVATVGTVVTILLHQ